MTRRGVLALAGLDVGFAVMSAQMRATVSIVVETTLGLTRTAGDTLHSHPR